MLLKNAPRCREEILHCIQLPNFLKGTHVVHDGWAATVNLPWEELGFTHTLVNHAQGEVVVEDPNAPFPVGHQFTTNHIESKWSALKRWMRKRAGGKLASQGWNNYISEYQWRKWWDRPVLEQLIEHVREVAAPLLQQYRDEVPGMVANYDAEYPQHADDSSSEDGGAPPPAPNIVDNIDMQENLNNYYIGDQNNVV